MAKTALIAGITGQDGAYLARHLLEAGYRVVGSSRDAQSSDTSRLDRLGIAQDIELISLAPNDFRSVLKALSSIEPKEVYNLAGQTSVGLSFEQPVECMESIAGGTLNFLEVLRYLEAPTRLFSAGSSECFGDTQQQAANEATAFHPRSPYAVAKSTAFWQVANYREAYGIFCCTGILANHESPLRPQRFVTQKIIDGVRRIKRGETQELRLGNLDIWRDWGWAAEYVVAMHQMLQAPTAKDYLIASGHTTSLREFVRMAFAAAGLEADKYLVSDATFLRPSDLKYSSMNPSQIYADLGWKAQVQPSEIVQKMYEERLL
ncbi:GDP-mannose 4,6-dehydratase [Cyanobium sp. L1E-Cus]|uniref:GDP-mannose 4,6-dehydratase n=1 Tax=Cyanobium sp. L1E-Cus TaxID=2823714 RepID=UPI0020CC3C2C|nr:GDP-mannose 4,6-dehydratase [Cyanobium sp. L1E-Cus]MCP9821902.1 GDP-mannose 4,6-dehydratase [Cyanobium sp. L1E-Cus]